LPVAFAFVTDFALCFVLDSVTARFVGFAIGAAIIAVVSVAIVADFCGRPACVQRLVRVAVATLGELAVFGADGGLFSVVALLAFILHTIAAPL
jgi:hypothetical protein